MEELHLKERWLPIKYATIAIILITVLTLVFGLDPLISGSFYEPGVGFPMKHNLLVRFFYQSIPVAVVASILFFIGFAITAYFRPQLRKHNRLVLALFISMVMGPGIIVNSIFKDNFGRPRPSQTIEFGGKHESRVVLEGNWGNYGKSFPSGHAAVPMSFILLVFAAFKRRKIRATMILGSSIIAWYLLVSYARVAAGGHHFSDVAWAGYFSFVCAWLCFLYIDRVTE